ncbi:hypothetical protein PFLG_01444 [Plasmodium falciparum RAJ116]|uniref:Uncharacterized protein n=1 Tax=Plasmodium falciparum RAJ116 TaxID=580058 RepID=A0A0L0CV41_PLAFA|nr:hypothetical protein PFLG_01444 [Plasmodium falciparum RAJ116]
MEIQNIGQKWIFIPANDQTIFLIRNIKFAGFSDIIMNMDDVDYISSKE